TICAAAVACFLAPLPALAHGHQNDNDQGTRRSVAVERSAVRGDVHVFFTSGDVRVLREYYEPRYRHLPPGLRKKYARTGQLPPGWARRIETLPVVVERPVVVLPPEYRRGVIDGNAVIYSPQRGVFIDATVV